MSAEPLTIDPVSAARRNLILLTAGMAALYGMVELATGTATLTFEDVGGSESLSGLAPALFLAAAASAAVPAGRAMDRFGRRPVLMAGFATGAGGCLIAAAGVSTGSLPAVLAGFVLTGFATQAVLLSRAAAADMFPPEGRPRAIALVLFGAVFGALLGPLVFIPLLGSGEGHGSSLDLAWVGAACFMAVGFAVVSRLRPDPQAIARALGHDRTPGGTARDPLRRVIARPGVPPAVLATVATYASMVAVMTLTGTALVDHGHDREALFPVLAAHFVGMFGLFAVVGRVIERIGRTASLVAGLVLLAASCAALLPAIETVAFAALALFGVGLGWSLAFVAATSELSERSSAGERASLLGFTDLLAGATGATFAVVGGVGLSDAGLAALALGAAVPPLLAAAWIVSGARAGGGELEAELAEPR